jgi:hypothetical protein
MDECHESFKGLGASSGGVNHPPSASAGVSRWWYEHDESFKEGLGTLSGGVNHPPVASPGVSWRYECDESCFQRTWAPRVVVSSILPVLLLVCWGGDMRVTNLLKKDLVPWVVVSTILLVLLLVCPGEMNVTNWYHVDMDLAPWVVVITILPMLLPHQGSNADLALESYTFQMVTFQWYSKALILYAHFSCVGTCWG